MTTANADPAGTMATAGSGQGYIPGRNELDLIATKLSTTQAPVIEGLVDNNSSCAPDWAWIESEYRVTTRSVRDIAGEAGISHQAISKRARAQSWSRPMVAAFTARPGSVAGNMLAKAVATYDAIGSVAQQRMELARRELADALGAQTADSAHDVAAGDNPRVETAKRALASAFAEAVDERRAAIAREPRLTAPANPEPADGFDWESNESIVAHEQRAIAVYLDERPGRLVIRQRVDWNQEDDSEIIVSQVNVQDLIDKLTEFRDAT